MASCCQKSPWGERGSATGTGLLLAREFGQRQSYHAGGISGFATVLQRYTESKHSLVVMSNLESLDTVPPVWSPPQSSQTPRAALRPIWKVRPSTCT